MAVVKREAWWPEISGIFVAPDPNAPDNYPTRADIDNFLAGNYGALTMAKLRILRDIVEDPDGVRWDEEHQDEITIPPGEFFPTLFLVFPVGDTYEESYQRLKRLIGPHPMNYSNVTSAIYEYERGCADGAPPPSKAPSPPYRQRTTARSCAGGASAPQTKRFATPQKEHTHE